MFDDNEQKAILKLIDSVIKADGKISIKEVDFLEEIMTTLSFEARNLSAISEFSYNQSIEIIKALGEEKKNVILKNISTVSEADNDVSPDELKILKEIKKLVQ